MARGNLFNRQSGDSSLAAALRRCNLYDRIALQLVGSAY